MFKSLGAVLNRKEKSLLINRKNNTALDIVFKSFIDQYFGDYKEAFKCSIYNEEGTIFINTGNKVIASELSLRIKELARILKDKGVQVSQIIIS